MGNLPSNLLKTKKIETKLETKIKIGLAWALRNCYPPHAPVFFCLAQTAVYNLAKEERILKAKKRLT